MNSSILPPLGCNVSLLRQKASRHSVRGVIIALVSILIATMASAYVTGGEISIQTITTAQKNNMVLWVLDAMPFVFAIWGQYVSFMLSHEAGTIIHNQTSSLRQQSTLLEQKALYHATHDTLTGLPNRALFMDRLQRVTVNAIRDKTIFAVLVLDLDHFKDVNDTLGHHNGDRLLRQVCLRLSSVVREPATLARIGGDEFGIILPNLEENCDIEQIAGRIKKSLAASFTLEGLLFEVQASIGVALSPEHGQDPDMLIKRADVAMYAAKRNKLGYALYAQHFDKNTPRRLTLMSELRQAINNDELVLHFQPKIGSRTGKIHAVEALVRWAHPIHGLLQPNEFIPLAERTGLIEELSLWVLENALRQGAIWYKMRMRLGIAINISSFNLLNPAFPELLATLLTIYDFPAESLILEITETSVMVNPDRSLAILDRINQLSVRLSIDDFGTGYSSLAYLKKLPVSELKIDQSFILDMLTNESDATIVNATIQLGHNLGLEVVAEGIENRRTFNILRSMGCDMQQGYFICRPVTPDYISNQTSRIFPGFST